MTGKLRKYNIYMLGAVSGADGPKTKDLRVALGNLIIARGHNLLTPHVAFDYEQTTFREQIGGLDNICKANIEFMDQADLFVAEGSGVSEGRGGEVFYGLYTRNVPVIYLREESWERGTNMIFGNKHPLLYVAMYTPETLESVFDNALALVSDLPYQYQGSVA